MNPEIVGHEGSEEDTRLRLVRAQENLARAQEELGLAERACAWEALEAWTAQFVAELRGRRDVTTLIVLGELVRQEARKLCHKVAAN